MDPNLVENTMNQLNAKNQALNYSSKYGALASQIVSIQSENLKLEQAKNKLKQANFKIKSDSIDLVAVKPNLK
jgi:hypothetical protein